MKIWGWVQEHPYEAGGLLAVVLLGIVFLTGGFKSNPAPVVTTSNNPQAAQLQEQLQLAQIQAGVATNQSNNVVTLGQDSIAASQVIAGLTLQRDTVLGSLAAGVQTAGITAQQAIATQSITAGRDVQLAGINSNVAVNSTNAGTLVDLAHIIAGTRTAPPVPLTLDQREATYIANNVDVANYFNEHEQGGTLAVPKGDGTNQNLTEDQYALWHFNQYGMNEGRIFPGATPA